VNREDEKRQEDETGGRTGGWQLTSHCDVVWGQLKKKWPTPGVWPSAAGRAAAMARARGSSGVIVRELQLEEGSFARASAQRE
jgi:hypothetical protein